MNKPLNDEFDARVWAAEFKRLNPGSDEELMLTWFANAIMAGYDHAMREARAIERVEPKESVWIPVSERLPEPDTVVLWTGYYRDSEGIWRAAYSYTNPTNAAIWQKGDPANRRVVRVEVPNP